VTARLSWHFATRSRASNTPAGLGIERARPRARSARLRVPRFSRLARAAATAEKPWDRLCDQLNSSGVPNLDDALVNLELRPVHTALRCSLIRPWFGYSRTLRSTLGPSPVDGTRGSSRSGVSSLNWHGPAARALCAWRKKPTPHAPLRNLVWPAPTVRRRRSRWPRSSASVCGCHAHSRN